MKRKTIQLAGKTLVVSLPHRWVKQQGLQKGADVDVIEQDDTLVISNNTHIPERKAHADLRNASERVVRWCLSGLHKQGADEIELLHDAEHIPFINDIIKNLFLGMVVVQQSNGRSVIRSVAADDQNQFSTVLRRAWLVTLSMGEELTSCLEQEEGFNNLLQLEKTNNQLTNFCQRLLNRAQNQSYFQYVIIWNLEKICDELKYICQKKPAASKRAIGVYKKTMNLLREYYELYYQFSTSRLTTLAEKKSGLLQEIDQQLKNGEDALLLSHVKHIVLQMADFSTSMFALNHPQI